mmetsp:Transcript_7326/g.6663  ORF Transcript_7326/g.6663 Transcript_7326/m.6663 type:complete len:324 (-) Transcript_7326:1131-2102(-)
MDIFTLDELLGEIRNQKAEDLTFLGNFIHSFKREKQMFKEDSFNLFELVNYIHEQKVSRKEFDLIQYYVSKMKKFFNHLNNNATDEYVDPRTPLPNHVMSQTFERICTKAEKQNNILDSFMEKVRDYYEHNRGDAVVERATKIIECNVTAQFILKYLQDLDQHLLSELDKIEDLSHYLKQDGIETFDTDEVKKRVYHALTGEDLPDEEGVIKRIMKTGEDVIGKTLQKMQKDKKKERESKKDDDDDDLINLLNEKKDPGKKNNDLDESLVFGNKEDGDKNDKLQESVALSGISDMIKKSGDPDQFKELMKKLAAGNNEQKPDN